MGGVMVYWISLFPKKLRVHFLGVLCPYWGLESLEPAIYFLGSSCLPRGNMEAVQASSFEASESLG